MRVPVDGAELDVSVTGEGPPVVVLHGLTGSRANDQAVGTDWPAALSDTHRVIAYDARGHGASTGRPQPADYDWRNLATDLFMVLDATDAGARVDGIGASMGTATLLHAAVREPDRFRRLILTIPPTAWQTRAAQADGYRQAADLAETYGVRRLIAMNALQPVPPACAGLVTPAPAIAEDLLPSVMRGAAGTDLPAPQNISRLEQPVLILAWTQDPGHPLSTTETLTDLLDDVTVFVAATPEQRAAWPQIARDFLT